MVDAPCQAKPTEVCKGQEGLVSWNECVKERNEEAYRYAIKNKYDNSNRSVKQCTDWPDIASQQLNLDVLHRGFNYLFAKTKWSLQKWAHEEQQVNELIKAAFKIIITELSQNRTSISLSTAAD